ncbi:hypothetical protein JTL88_35265, partial [Pseudomonas aeruginosa]|nr:hypothetical protein [Pseudomonas aeruginosa]
GIPVAIDPLDESIKAELEAMKKPSLPEIQPLKFVADVFKWPATEMLLQAGESAYYLQVERADRNPEQLYIKITAQDKRLSFNFDPVRETLSSAWLSDVSF